MDFFLSIPEPLSNWRSDPMHCPLANGRNMWLIPLFFYFLVKKSQKHRNSGSPDYFIYGNFGLIRAIGTQSMI